MKPSYVLVEQTGHPSFEEGAIYDFDDFETLCIAAARITSGIDDKHGATCVDVSVYFEAPEVRVLKSHLHVDSTGDFGWYDWLGKALADTTEPVVLDFLSSIHIPRH